MNYSQHTNHVRVDFFKESGKWYTTHEVEWKESWEDPILTETFKRVLRRHLYDGAHKPYRLTDMIAVCLNPFHEKPWPLMQRISEL